MSERVLMNPVAAAVAGAIGYELPLVHGSVQFYVDEGLTPIALYAQQARDRGAVARFL
jgi:hypothetical protein